jgi:hypothetical protein
MLFESERTPGFEPGSTGCELGVVPRCHGGRWKERAEENVFIFSLQPCTRKSVREVKIDLQITQNISKHDLTHEKGVNCPKCNHIASSNDGLKNAFKNYSRNGTVHECEKYSYKSKTSYGLILHVKKAHLDLSKSAKLKVSRM